MHAASERRAAVRAWGASRATRPRLVLALMAALLLAVGGVIPASQVGAVPASSICHDCDPGGGGGGDGGGGTTAPQPIATARVTVPEWSRGVATGIWVQPGQRLEVRCADTIWAGSYLFGRNDANGIWGWSADSSYPLPGYRIYSAVGLLNNRYFYVGTSHSRVHENLTSQLVLRTNDNVPGNGNGAFTCNVALYAS